MKESCGFLMKDCFIHVLIFTLELSYGLSGQCMQLNSCECGNLGIRKLCTVCCCATNVELEYKKKCILQLYLFNGLPLVHYTKGLCYHICVNVSGTLSFTKLQHSM